MFEVVTQRGTFRFGFKRIPMRLVRLSLQHGLTWEVSEDEDQFPDGFGYACFIVEGEEELISAMVVCDTRDQFVKELGRKKALARALGLLTEHLIRTDKREFGSWSELKAVRKMFWKVYLERGNDQTKSVEGAEAAGV